MATANRIKQKRRAQASHQYKTEPTMHQRNTKPRTKIFGSNQYQHTQQKEQQYQKYYQISQCNPVGIVPTMTLFPNSHNLSNSFCLPLGFSFSPMISMQNQTCPFMEKTGDKLPRCEHCNAYMNCYNQIQKKKYVCFLCGNQNAFPKQYKPLPDKNQELNSPIFQCLSPVNYYNNSPPEDCFVFLIDISPDSAQCKMLFYFVSAMKQILESEQYDETVICFYTYDQIIQEYDFSGEQIKCTIMDQTIQHFNIKKQWKTLKQIRTQLFQLLDNLEQISQSNPRRGSNFSHAFDYCFLNTNQMSPKIFIFQANQNLIGEPMFVEQPLKRKSQGQTVPPKSLFESRNKQFISRFLKSINENIVTINMYCFQKTYRNLKVLSDTFKLSNSALRVYNKDQAQDLNKFYYELTSHLGAVSFKNVRTQFLINHGYHYTSVLSSNIRIKQEKKIVFFDTSLDLSKKIHLIFAPNSDLQCSPFPYIASQISMNYRYKRQDFFCCFTAVFPITGYLNRLYQSIDTMTVSAILAKNYLINIRSAQINAAKKQLVDNATNIWKRALQYYKSKENVPYQIQQILASTLAMLKSIFSQAEYIVSSVIMDRVICDRLFFASCPSQDVFNYFKPYLFDLNNLQQTMCRDDIEFVYPPTVQPRFINVKEGIYLLDNGLYLYLFIAKQCHPQILQQLVGKQKLAKNDVLNQQMIAQGTSYLAYQINVLVRVLREQKVNGWVPLYIVRCGQNSLNEKNFYMSFFNENYDQFKSYKASFEEYLALLARNQEIL